MGDDVNDDDDDDDDDANDDVNDDANDNDDVENREKHKLKWWRCDYDDDDEKKKNISGTTVHITKCFGKWQRLFNTIIAILINSL